MPPVECLPRATAFQSSRGTYDNANKLLIDQQGLIGGPTKAVEYRYDDANENTRVFINDPWGYDRTFKYDPMGRFEKILNTSDLSVWFQYQYDPSSNVTKRMNKLNLIDQDYGTRDQVNRMPQRELEVGGVRMTTAGALETYGYSSMNRITSVTREDGKIDSFGYNAPGELTSASYQWANRSVTYNLDLVGNRNSVVDNGTTKNYTPDNINRYTTADSLAPNSNNVGQGPEHQIGSFENTNYSYVGDSYVAQITGNGTTYTVGYDALGRCVKRTFGAATTYYVYDGEKPIAEYNPAGTQIANNVYGKGIDEILMRFDTAVVGHELYFYQDDHEGNITT